MGKKLGFGLMRLPMLDPDDRTSIDIEQVKKMVDIFMERGFTYFDTAWMYHKHASEKAVKEFLTSRYPRDSYTLTTKLHSEFFNSIEERDNIFKTQLEKTGVEYFDYYLLHDVNEKSFEKFEKFDCINFVRNLKKQGLIKHYGFSFHDKADVLDRILTKYPDFEYVQLQVNYIDWESPEVESRKCYEVATRHNKPVIVMEPVKGGTLAKVTSDVESMFKDYNPEASIPSWAVRFVASLPNVFVVLSGMSNLAQLEDNTGFMQDFKPLNEEEEEIINKARTMLGNNIAYACTECEYCMEGCPQKIAIPRCLALYNAEKQESDWAASVEKYNKLIETYGKAGDCIGCGQCENICPQHLSIIDGLKKVAATFEE